MAKVFEPKLYIKYIQDSKSDIISSITFDEKTGKGKITYNPKCVNVDPDAPDFKGTTTNLNDEEMVRAVLLLKLEKVIDGYTGFLFYDDDGNPLVAKHWQHRFNRMVGRYNDIYRVQMPKITPHVCRHTYCSNMAKAGMNPKTLQYLMGHSDIGVTMNTYTHLGLEDAQDEMIRMEELNAARAEVAKTTGEKPVTQKQFRVV